MLLVYQQQESLHFVLTAEAVVRFASVYQLTEQAVTDSKESSNTVVDSLVFNTSGGSIIYEIWGYAAAISFGWLLNSFLTARVDRAIQDQITFAHLRAASSLLAFVCDAVVELDDEFHFTNHSPQLSQLLLRQMPTSLQGKHFLDLLASDEERERVSGILKMRSESQAQEQVQHQVQTVAFNTHMLDSCGAKVGIECFQVCIEGSLSCAHLLGIRESTDAFTQKPVPDCENSHDQIDRSYYETSSSCSLLDHENVCARPEPAAPSVTSVSSSLELDVDEVDQSETAMFLTLDLSSDSFLVSAIIIIFCTLCVCFFSVVETFFCCCKQQ